MVNNKEVDIGEGGDFLLKKSDPGDFDSIGFPSPGEISLLSWTSYWPLTPREFAENGNLKPLMLFLTVVEANC